MKKVTIITLVTKYALGAVLALVSCNLFAHVALQQSEPAANAHLCAAPEQLRLNFSTDVRLMKVAIVNGEGEPQPLAFKPSAKAREEFTLALPNLPASSYSVHWSSLGDDGHKMSGEFDFMVMDQCDGEQADTPQPVDDHSAHHGH